jgi:uncharacterized protein YndB with AHSA1/START domain
MNITAKAAIQIKKPIEVVFEAIVNPEKMTNYFIHESSGRLETGKEVIWKFNEFPESFPVNDINIEAFYSIKFVWDLETVVTISLATANENETVVKVSETGKKDVDWALQNTEGWANFLACLKAYIEHGINLRIGAFDFMKNVRT